MAISPRKRPIPDAMAERNDLGMPAIIQLRAPVAVNKIKIIPDIKTAPNACCQVKPNAPTTVKAKKAFKPIPGAKPMGQLATNAIVVVPTTAAKQVATKIAPRSMPVEERSEERRVGKECRSRRRADQAEDGIRDGHVTGVQTCALPIS